ncbi:MAG TPA: ChaN family lipoprotein, partial [Gemmataceae bacterium]|nr:ChaN family lipoprotein [Gemmataceae bacterium]
CSPLCAFAEQPPVGKDLEARLRQLEKQIASVRGLAFKSPVVAKVIPRPKDAAQGIQGYYSLKDKALFLYDDIRGNYEQGVLIHEMVHALQDQHFGLKRLHQTTFDSDADLARAALIEGDATYTMIELLRKDQPNVAKMLDVPLAKAKNLRNAFLYAQGARYVKALKERGGWTSVNFAYKFPPRTTASILHPEGVTTIQLGPGKTRGEYGLIEMLAGHPKTAPLAVQAAAGWKGDRYVEEGTRKWWVIRFGTKEQAERCRDALSRLCQLTGSRAHLHARGERVLMLEAPEGGHSALLERLEGPLSLSVYSRKEKGSISFGELVDRLVEADLICVGETHDSEPHHAIQLRIIKALFARDERLGVGMEMFQRPFQESLDRYHRGEIGEDVLLKETEYPKRWGYDWSLYRPIAEFCRKNGVPLAALNVPAELTRRLSKVGHAGLSEDEKKQLGAVDFHVKEHRDHWFEQLAQMHGDKKATAEQKERSYQVMTAWDDYMADSAARFQQERRVRRLVVLAGSGHIDRGFGIPQRAAKRTGGKVLTVTIAFDGDKRGEPTTDFVVVVR